MRVRMFPGQEARNQPNGISRVIDNYYRYGSEVGIEFVDDDSYDLLVSHAGLTGSRCDVAILHGLYFTGDYPANNYEFRANQNIVDAVRSAKVITVPSTWVAEIMQRDLRINPFVVPHGVVVEDWAHDYTHGGYVLYNKNRDGMDVCNSEQLDNLALLAGGISFVTTFSKIGPGNVKIIGVQNHDKMKTIVQRSMVYLSITKETFGIGVLEAMASGVPVLGWNYGGNVDLVEHGVNGYLAEPGNYDDLRKGLDYCIQYRRTLGMNGIELAKQWTWQNAVMKLRDAFDAAYDMVSPDPSVSVIIPVYNYANGVGRAIDSVVNQSLIEREIIVVDDGSTQDIRAAVDQKIEQYPNESIKFIRKENGGVATARNLGASFASNRYLCFLDADDKIEPDYLRVCVDELERDNSLYIAYTGLQWVNSIDGTTGVSQWPGKWDFDMQVARKNQVPTCCVIRKSGFDRLGGFRQRYAPNGAGSEDADLWTRFGLYGMKAKQVTEAPMFTYSVGSGNVSGNKEYREVDWLGWHSCIHTGQYPFAAWTTPRKMAHKVFQYDQPEVSVVIPVGPGHANKIVDALDSLEAQTIKKWEVIVVWDSPEPPVFDGLSLLEAYPYIRFYRTEHPKSGAGKARNLGASYARGNFLVFLDADDWLAPTAIENMLMSWATGRGIVYSDYIGIATVEDPTKINNIIEYNQKKKTAKIAYKSAEYDCQRAQMQPENPLYHWCLVTCLIPKAWHDEIKYDETMESWEDVDYHWRMARAGKCYVHINEPLVYYRFDTGTRRVAASSEKNVATAQKLLNYMKQKYEKEPNMANCITCGQAAQTIRRDGVGVQRASQSQGDDNDYVMILYKHANRGDHPVYGPATQTYYGYRAGGEKFLVHISDQRLMPDLFALVDNGTIPASNAPTAPVAETAAPKPISVTSTAPDIKVDKSKPLNLQTIPGISASTARSFESAGIDTIEKLRKLSKEEIIEMTGITEIKAKTIIRALEVMNAD